MDFSKLQNKKIYEYVLSSSEASSDLKNGLQSILRKAIEEPSHFEFLLHRVNWFVEPFRSYADLLERTVRLYQGKGKEAAKVAYNLLIQALSIQQSNSIGLQCLKGLLKDSIHCETIFQSLKQNYPHKLCPLSMHLTYMDSLISLTESFPDMRFEILEIIIENLAYFDTELLIGENIAHRHFIEVIFLEIQDLKFKDLRKQATSENAEKYDILLSKFLRFVDSLEKDELLLRQIFQIFQDRILPIKNTKIIQFVVYYLAESSKSMCNKFISLLLANIFDSNVEKEIWYRVFTQSTFYLISYVGRSQRISPNKTAQIVSMLVAYLSQRLNQVPDRQLDERLRLKEIFTENERNLHVLQAILTIVAYQPYVKMKLNDELQDLIKKCRVKIHFNYFIHEELLVNLNLIGEQHFKEAPVTERNYRKTLKFSNKFNPVILPKVAELIDPVFRWRQDIEHKYDCFAQKRHKVSREDFSFCEGSETGPTHG